MEFYDLDLSDEVLDALDSMRFSKCTPIQEKAIPPLLEGRDLIGVAQTGTGKTAAFLLPVIDSLSYGGYPENAINCLIMAPTRELARQIDEQLEGFSYFLPVNSLAVYGGNNGEEFSRQRNGLKMGADIIIATPGRLISHLSMGYVDLSKVSFFILDEADRMLDMGFFDDIMMIASKLPKDRQTIMFSATMPPKIRKLAESVLHDPVQIQIAVSRPADNIRQQVVRCHEAQKLQVVRKVFSDEALAQRSLIFASSKLKVKELARTLREMKYDVGEMHSDLDQARRDEVMHAYKSGKLKMLVATDIVARGIDIDDIKLVMNYDVPREGEEYVHRIGRTARAGNDGSAITLVSDDDVFRWNRIEKFLGKKIETLKVGDPEIDDYKPGKASANSVVHKRAGNHNQGRRHPDNSPSSEDIAKKPRRRRGKKASSAAALHTGITHQQLPEGGEHPQDTHEMRSATKPNDNSARSKRTHRRRRRHPSAPEKNQNPPTK